MTELSAIRQAIASTLGIVRERNVKIVDTSHFATERRRLQTARFTIQVTWNASLFLQDVGYTDFADAFTDLSSRMRNSIQNGAFMRLLRILAPIFNGVTVETELMNFLAPTAQPTGAVIASENNVELFFATNAVSISVSIGGFLLVAVFVCLLFWHHTRTKLSSPTMSSAPLVDAAQDQTRKEAVLSMHEISIAIEDPIDEQNVATNGKLRGYLRQVHTESRKLSETVRASPKSSPLSRTGTPKVINRSEQGMDLSGLNSASAEMLQNNYKQFKSVLTDRIDGRKHHLLFHLDTEATAGDEISRTAHEYRYQPHSPSNVHLSSPRGKSPRRAQSRQPDRVKSALPDTDFQLDFDHIYTKKASDKDGNTLI